MLADLSHSLGLDVAFVLTCKVLATCDKTLLLHDRLIGAFSRDLY